MILNQSATFERNPDGAITIQCSVCFFSGFSTCHCGNIHSSSSDSQRLTKTTTAQQGKILLDPAPSAKGQSSKDRSKRDCWGGASSPRIPSDRGGSKASSVPSAVASRPGLHYSQGDRPSSARSIGAVAALSAMKPSAGKRFISGVSSGKVSAAPVIGFSATRSEAKVAAGLASPVQSAKVTTVAAAAAAALVKNGVDNNATSTAAAVAAFCEAVAIKGQKVKVSSNPEPCSAELPRLVGKELCVPYIRSGMDSTGGS